MDNKGSNYKIKKQLLTSYLAGLSASIITLPIWTLRMRITMIRLDKEDSKIIKNRIEYFYLTVKESIVKEGVLKLYKGIFSSVILSFHGGIQMTIYETGKQIILSKSQNSSIANKEGSILGVISKISASFILYPFNVIRARQQIFSSNISNLNENLKKHTIITDKNYGLFLNTIKLIKETNGTRGFYQGILPTVLRQIPASSSFFYTYEYILKLFK
jgi:hypothetical protein